MTSFAYGSNYPNYQQQQYQSWENIEDRCPPWIRDPRYQHQNIEGGWGNDVLSAGHKGYGNVTTIHGGDGFDTVLLEGNPWEYMQGMMYENGEMFRTFTDAKGNMIKIAGDVENIQFGQQNSNIPNPWDGGGYQDPILGMLNDWFMNFMKMFSQMQNQHEHKRIVKDEKVILPIEDPTIPPRDDTTQQPKMDANKAIQTILNNFNICDTASGGGDTDGLIGRGDLEIIANSEGLDPELRAAAKFLLENKAVYSSAFANSSPFTRGEDRLDAMGLKLALNNFPPTTTNTDPVEETPQQTTLPQVDVKAALKKIIENFNICDTASGGGDTDGKIGKGDLQIIANSEGLDPELRAAAKLLLENKAVFSNVYANSSPFGRGEDRIDMMGLAGAYKAFGG